MNDPRIHDPIRRELRILKGYAAASTLAIVILLVAAFRPASHLSLETLDVERINFLNESGLPALAIAGHGRLPGPTFEGKEYPQELSGGRTTASGMIFFNERGDEVGGLTYHGQLSEDGYSAGGGITFDQFRQDQVVSLGYQDNGSSRYAGVNVWDRSTEFSLGEILQLVEARAGPPGAARDSAEAAIRVMAAQGLGNRRIFLGSRNRTAALGIRDTAGRERIRLYVDSLDVPRLEFLDAAGEVVLTLPQQ
jgi:hypothetical protein